MSTSSTSKLTGLQLATVYITAATPCLLWDEYKIKFSLLIKTLSNSSDFFPFNNIRFVLTIFLSASFSDTKSVVNYQDVVKGHS